jgi:hypothetical protein
VKWLVWMGCLAIDDSCFTFKVGLGWEDSHLSK